MEIRFEIKGGDRIVLGLKKVTQETLDAIHESMVMSGKAIRNRMIHHMKTTPKLGRTYRHGKMGRIHVASVSPNYPAIDFGGLVGSLYLDEKRLNIEVGSYTSKLRKGKKNKYGGLQYPLFLEEGTKRMGKRPWVKPTYDKSKEMVRRSIERAVNRTITQAGGAAT